MSASTIIAIENLRTMDQVAAAGAHNSRTNPPSHANTTRLNVVLCGGEVPVTERLIARLREAGIKISLKKTGLHRKAKKARRERIIALDILCAVGESFFAQQDPVKWAEQTLAYVAEVFGAQNILRADLHLDERVPHLHIMVVPITPNRRLSANSFYTQYQNEVAEDLNGIRRGKTTTPFFRRLQKGFFDLCHRMDPSLKPPVPGGVMTHGLVSSWRAWAGKAHQNLPKLPAAKVNPPTPSQYLAPEAYALREVEAFRQRVLPMVETLHSKAAQYDQVKASNQHLEKNLQVLDKKNAELDQTLKELQNRFRNQQDLLDDVSEVELCEQLGLPVEEINGIPHVVRPSGELTDLPTLASHRPYTLPTWKRMPSLIMVGALLGHSPKVLEELLRDALPEPLLDRLAAYQGRRAWLEQFEINAGYRKENLAGSIAQDLHSLARITPLDSGLRGQLAKNLSDRFGIAEACLGPAPEWGANFTVTTTTRGHLAIEHRGAAFTDGIAITGTELIAATKTPFEQHLGWFLKNPPIIVPHGARHTVIVSNLLEAFSLLSIPQLRTTLAVVVSGVARVDEVVREVLRRPYPVTLLEYAAGRRCARHRKLRESLDTSQRKWQGLSPSKLRPGTLNFESIAAQVRADTSLGKKLAQIFGVAATAGVGRLTPKPVEPQAGSTNPDLRNDGSSPGIK